LSSGATCKSAAQTPAASQDVVHRFLGKTLILRHRGDAKVINQADRARARGSCDVVSR
jgi:hypothetical protein